MSHSMPRRPSRIMRALLFFVSFTVLAPACGGTLDVVSGGPADSSAPDAGSPDGALLHAEWNRQIKVTRDEADIGAGLGQVIAANETTIVTARLLGGGPYVTDGTTVIDTFERRGDSSPIWVRMPELSLEAPVKVDALALHGDILFVSYAVWGYGGYDHQGIRRFRRDGTQWTPISDLIPPAKQLICALAVNDDGRALVRYTTGMIEIYDASARKEYAELFEWEPSPYGQAGSEFCPIAFSNGVAAISTKTPSSAPNQVFNLVTIERKSGNWVPSSRPLRGELFRLAVTGNQIALVEHAAHRTTALALYAKDEQGTWALREDVFTKSPFSDTNDFALAAHGSLIVYRYNEYTTSTVPTTKVFAKNGEQWALIRSFGGPSNPVRYSLALAGDAILLGSPSETVTAEKEGAIFLHERGFPSEPYDDTYRTILSASPTYAFGTNVAFSRQEMLVSDDSIVYVHELDGQGNAVYRDALDHRVIGGFGRLHMAANDDTLATLEGANQLHLRRRKADGRWGPKERLITTESPAAYRPDMSKLVMDDNTIVAFMPWFYSYPGPVEDYVPVFRRTASGYAQEALLSIPTGEPKYVARDVLSLSKGRLLVATKNTQTARVYVRNEEGRWAIESDLSPSKKLFVYRAGALDGDRLVLVSYDADNSYGAYVFDRTGSTWRETARIALPRVDDVEAALSGNDLAIGTDKGVNLYRWDAGAWTLQRQDLGKRGRASALVFSGDRLAVGMPGEDVARKGNAGAAYLLYRR